MLIMQIQRELLDVNVSDRQINQILRENHDTNELLVKFDDEIEDLREQVSIKQRAPTSKKRASDNRLSRAHLEFDQEEADCVLKERLVCSVADWQLLTSETEPSCLLRFKVAIERNRYFIVQVQKYGQELPVSSKRSPAIRFDDCQA